MMRVFGQQTTENAELGCRFVSAPQSIEIGSKHQSREVEDVRMLL